MGKKRTEYTVADMRRLDLSWLKKNQPDELVTKMRENIDYVTRLASDLGYSQFVGKSYLGTFPDELHSYDKNDLNKLVVESMNNDKTSLATEEAAPQLQYLQLAQDEQAFKDNRGEDLDEKISSVSSEIESYTERADSYYDSYSAALEALHLKNEALQSYEELKENIDPDAQRTDIIESITQVIKAGDWVYLGSSQLNHKVKCYRTSFRQADKSKAANGNGTASIKGHLFLSAAPIYCTYSNPAAGSHMSVNFGHILVAMSDSGMITRYVWCLDFMESAGTTHPHLSGNSICWGSGLTSYNTLTSGAAVDFHRILCLFKSLLENYCPDNPYRPLSRYNNMRNHRYAWADMDSSLLSRIPSKLLGDSYLEVALYIEKVKAVEDYTRMITAEHISLESMNQFRESIGDALFTKMFAALYSEGCEDEEGGIPIKGTGAYSIAKNKLSEIYYGRENYHSAFLNLLQVMKDLIAEGKLEAFTVDEFESLHHLSISNELNDSERGFFFMWLLASPEVVAKYPKIWATRPSYSHPYRYVSTTVDENFKLSGDGFRNVFIPMVKYINDSLDGTRTSNERVASVTHCFIPAFSEEPCNQE